MESNFNETTNSYLGKVMEIYRTENSVSTTKLGQSVPRKISSTQLRKYERGQDRIPIGTFIVVSSLLDIPLSEVFEHITSTDEYKEYIKKTKEELGIE